MGRLKVCISPAARSDRDRDSAAELIQALVRRFLTHARLCDKEVVTLLAALKLWSKNNVQRLLERKDLGDWRVQVLLRTVILISTTSRHPFRRFPYRLAYIRQLLRQLRAAQAASEKLYVRQRTEYTRTYSERHCMQLEDKHETLLNNFWRDQQRIALAEQARNAEKERLEYVEGVRRKRHKHAENVVGKVTEEEANELGERELMRLEDELQRRVVAWHKSLLQQRLDVEREFMRQEDLQARFRRDTALAEAARRRELAVEAAHIAGLRRSMPVEACITICRPTALAAGDVQGLPPGGDTWRQPFCLREALSENSLDALSGPQAFDHKAMRQLRLLEVDGLTGSSARSIDVLMKGRVAIDESCYVSFKKVRALKAERRVRLQAHHTSSALLGCFEMLFAKLTAVRQSLRLDKISTRVQRKVLLEQAERLEQELCGVRSDLIFTLDCYHAAARREVWLLLQVVDEAVPPRTAAVPSCVQSAAALLAGAPLSELSGRAKQNASAATKLDSTPLAKALGKVDVATAQFSWLEDSQGALLPPLPPPRCCTTDASTRAPPGPARAPMAPKSAPAKIAASLSKAVDSKAASREVRLKAGLAKRLVDPLDRKTFQVPGVRSFLLESAEAYDFVRWARAARLWMSEVSRWFSCREERWRQKHRAAAISCLQRLQLLLHGPAAAASNDQHDLQLLLQFRSESVLILMELMLSQGGLEMQAYDTRSQEEYSLHLSAGEADRLLGRHPVSLVARFLMERGLHGHGCISAAARSSLELLSRAEGLATRLLDDLRGRLCARLPAYSLLDLRLPGELASEEGLRRALMQDVEQSAQLFARACSLPNLLAARAASSRAGGRLIIDREPSAAGPLMFIKYDRARRDWDVPLWMQPAYPVANPRCGRGGKIARISSLEQCAEQAAIALCVRLRFLAILRRNFVRVTQLGIERGTMEHEDALAAVCRQRGYHQEPVRRRHHPLLSLLSLFRRHAKVSTVRYQERHIAVLRSPWPDQLLAQRRTEVGWDTFDKRLLLQDEDGARRNAAAIHKRLLRRVQAMRSQSPWVSGAEKQSASALAGWAGLRVVTRFKPDLQSVTLAGGMQGVVGLARVVEDVDSLLRSAPVAEQLPPTAAILVARTGFVASRYVDENSLSELAHVRVIDSNRKLSERSYASLHDGRVASEPVGAAAQRLLEHDIWRDCFQRRRYSGANERLIVKAQALVRSRIAARKVRALRASSQGGQK